MVQNTHHHLLAVVSRQRGDAQVDLALLEDKIETTVLGQSPHRDVQVGNHLESRNDGVLSPLRESQVLLHDAVHPVADLYHVDERLNVDIAGAGVDGVRQDQVAELHDGLGFAGDDLLQVVDFVGRGDGLDVVLFRRVDALHEGLQRTHQPVLSVDRVEDVTSGRDDDLHL